MFLLGTHLCSELWCITLVAVNVTEAGTEEGRVILPPGGRRRHGAIGIHSSLQLTVGTPAQCQQNFLYLYSPPIHILGLHRVDLSPGIAPTLPRLVLFLPGLFPRLQVMVKAVETVLIESISYTLVVALAVFLKVVQQVAMTAVLENQVYRSYRGQRIDDLLTSKAPVQNPM